MDGFRMRSAAAGEVIFREGEIAQRSYILLTGTLQLSRQTPDGPVAVGEVSPGETFGEIPAFKVVTRPCTARMSTAGQYLEISSNALTHHLEQVSPVVRQLLNAMVQRLDSLVAVSAPAPPQHCRRLFTALAHLLYQMNLALKSDGAWAMPYERALRQMTTITGGERREIEGHLQTFAALGLLDIRPQAKLTPQLVFLVRDGFLGRALRHADAGMAVPEAG